jgi:hypothetical protein
VGYIVTTVTKVNIATVEEKPSNAQPANQPAKAAAVPNVTLVANDLFGLKPVNRADEAIKTVAWTAPIGAAAGALADKFLVAPNAHFTKALAYLKDQLPSRLPSVPEDWSKWSLHLDKLVHKAGISQHQLEVLQQKAANMPMAQIMQHPEKLLHAAHIGDAGHMLANIGLGALFTGVVGAGMSQLFAQDKQQAYDKLAEINDRLQEEKAHKAVEKQLKAYKKRKEAMENRADIAEIEAALAAENQAMEKNG